MFITQLGEFGVVYKADYSQPEGDDFEDTLYTVAVKTLKGEEVWLV